MNVMHHMKSMLIGGAVLFGVLLVFGVPLQSALFFALALACPLMMVFMMGGGHGGHGAGSDHDRMSDRGHEEASHRTDIARTHQHGS